MNEKSFLIDSEHLKELFHWDAPEGCYASDRITKEGCKVGYMYREEPDAESPMPDSGWRFTAGDESDEYINNPNNVKIYTLNTMANYDMEIVPFLNAPYGSAFFRDDSGKLVEDLFED